MSDPTPEDLCRAGEAAVRAFLGELDQPQLSTGKYVFLIETLDVDGERVLYQALSDGQTAWDTLGLLTYAAERLDDD